MNNIPRPNPDFTCPHGFGTNGVYNVPLHTAPHNITPNVTVHAGVNITNINPSVYQPPKHNTSYHVGARWHF